MNAAIIPAIVASAYRAAKGVPVMTEMHVRFHMGRADRKHGISTGLRRVDFKHRGRNYHAIRFNGGRVELYRAAGKDGIERFIRYAVPSKVLQREARDPFYASSLNAPSIGDTLDDKAIRLLADRWDPAMAHGAAILKTSPNAVILSGSSIWGVIAYADKGKTWYTDVQLFSIVDNG
jgi:hypothetical protein